MAIVTYRSCLGIILLSIFLLGSCAPKPDANPVVDLTAVLSEVKGEVEARLSEAGEYAPATDGMVLQVGGQVRTGDGGSTRLDLSTGTLIRVASSSQFTLLSNEPVNDGLFSRLRLEAGRLWIILNGGTAEVETPSGVAAVRGSYLMVEVLPDGGVLITCLEGTCDLGNEAGSVSLTSGQNAVISNYGSAPVAGKMTDGQVNDWLANNPEAALVIPATETPTPTPSLTPTATSTPLPVSGPARVILDSRCREGTDTRFAILTYLSIDQQVTVIGWFVIKESEDWYLIEIPDKPGSCWVRADYLELQFSLAGVPTVVPPATPTALPQLPEFKAIYGPTLSFLDCHQVYGADIDNAEGIQSVVLYYQSSFSGSGSMPVPGYGSHYEITAVLPGTGGETITYWFVATDMLGKQITSEKRSYTLFYTCP